MKFFSVFISITLIAKILNLIRAFKLLSSITELIVSSVGQVLPLLILFILFTGWFAIQYYILGTYQGSADDNGKLHSDYPFLNQAFGYFFVSFGNGVGDFAPPTFSPGT